MIWHQIYDLRYLYTMHEIQRYDSSSFEDKLSNKGYKHVVLVTIVGKGMYLYQTYLFDNYNYTIMSAAKEIAGENHIFLGMSSRNVEQKI
ncbi:hypothetical protein K4L44_03090 [Halosquirtibacter laminarini]|uniref:Uncharacterized protein n=1 Tax=Halosquirtibacter laminarini TaxID=3374600 RepID=A0AC61NGU3_9BACT|nr:hypothetical protein K4L44_03090 [Prolixibacteraceae bacterium]